MEVHQLRYLVEVVDAGSFTAAATRLHVAQSGLSAQVAKLERELGVGLLERVPRGVRPTGAGRAVVVRAREALAALEAVTDAAHEHADLLRGAVRVGLVRGTAMTTFLGALAGFVDEHPGVDVRLGEQDSARLEADVLAGELDLALLAYAGAPSAGLEVTVVVEEPLAAVVRRDEPLVRDGDLRLADLATSGRLLALGRGTGARDALDAACARAGLGATPRVESDSPTTLVALVAAGLGVAVLSASTARAHVEATHPARAAHAGGDEPSLAVVGLTGRRGRAAARSTLALVTRRGGSNPAADRLRAALLDALRPQGAG